MTSRDLLMKRNLDCLSEELSVLLEMARDLDLLEGLVTVGVLESWLLMDLLR